MSDNSTANKWTIVQHVTSYALISDSKITEERLVRKGMTTASSGVGRSLIWGTEKIMAEYYWKTNDRKTDQNAKWHLHPYFFRTWKNVYEVPQRPLCLKCPYQLHLGPLPTGLETLCKLKPKTKVCCGCTCIQPHLWSCLPDQPWIYAASRLSPVVSLAMSPWIDLGAVL